VRLAGEVSTGLTGITYVLDEPTAGLHPRDTDRLLDVIRNLRDAGNTVVVVEHDLDVILAADHVMDLGPGAGAEGGRLVASGTPAEVEATEVSPTGEEMRRRRARTSLKGRDVEPRQLRPGISVRHATCHNLRDLALEIPAGGLVAVTGVSGSGKSTLVFDVIAQGVKERLGPARRAGRDEDRVVVHEPFVRLVAAHRETLPRSPSSNPATVMDVAGAIRQAFAATEDARARALKPLHFSTQAKGGRCEACEGAGRKRVSMDFLPDVWVPCDACEGRRYLPEILACHLRGRSIADVLEGTVREALALFAEDQTVAPSLRLLDEIGLGYVRLGQGADTLSGGERQRLALAADLAATAAAPSLYLFDEPTSGLHGADVTRLLRLFDRLVAAGHTLVAVEHHLGVIGAADYVIDLGPEGGVRGGLVVATGSPWDIANAAGSWTGVALARVDA
jgi:excinuclease ABC subunit A